MAFRFEPPKSWAKKKKELVLNPPAWMSSRPDVDNLGKMVLEVLVQGGIIKDDSQVAELYLTKSYYSKSETFAEVQSLK